MAYLDEGIAIARKHHHRMRTPLLMNRADIACRERDTKAAAAWLEEARTALSEDYPDAPWRAAQLENVALFCQALTPGARPDLQRLLATLPEIHRHWSKDRLYARGALAHPARFCRSGQAAGPSALIVFILIGLRQTDDVHPVRRHARRI